MLGLISVTRPSTKQWLNLWLRRRLLQTLCKLKADWLMKKEKRSEFEVTGRGKTLKSHGKRHSGKLDLPISSK